MKALSVRHLTKTYANNVVALKDIDLDVEEGDFFALLGQNGAGKSTTIGIVSSLVTKTSGKVLVFDYDLDTAFAEAKSFIGIVPQEVNFNIFEKISHILINQAGYYGIPSHIAKKRMEQYLQEMGLWHMRDMPAFRLSGGMKRRLLIARALMNEPRLLILDEPTAGVDVELRHTLWNFLRKINKQGTTIILTTHYLEEAEHLCKHVAIIDRGEIIEKADMKSLIGRLRVQTFLLDFKLPQTIAPHLPGFPMHLVDEVTAEIRIERHQSINDLFKALSAEHIEISGLRNKTNRLEELFMHLITTNKIEKS